MTALSTFAGLARPLLFWEANALKTRSLDVSTRLHVV